MMSTHSRTCFVWRNKQEAVPAAFATEVLKNYSSWNGIVFAHDGEILMGNETKPATLNGLNNLLVANNDKNIGLIFGKEDGVVDPKNMQPFPIISVGEGDDEQHKVVVIVDGPFEKYGTNSDRLGRPYIFTNTYLKPKFMAMWTMVGGDVGKFIEAIQQKYCHDEILAAAGPGSCVAVISSDPSKTAVFMHPDCNSDEYSWGFTNDCLNYSEDNEAAEAAASAAKGNKGKPTLSLSGDTSVIDALNLNKNKDTSSPVLWQGRIPDDITTNRLRKELYASFHGNEHPGGWKNTGDSRPWVTLLPNMVEAARTAGWQMRPMPHIAGTTPIPQPTSSPLPGGPPAAPAAEVLETVVKEKTLKFIQAIDSNTLRVMTPEEMDKNEKENPTFFDQFGVKYENTIKWNKATILDLCKNFPTTSAPQLLMDYANIIYNLEKQLEEATEPATPAATPTITPAAPPVAAPKKRFSMG
jgi:hypothetical protein